MKTVNKLKAKIMRRVYAIWVLRQIVKPFMVEALFFAAAVFWMAFYVSFGNVLANISPIAFSPTHLISFIASAFESTEFISKVLFSTAIILSILLIKDLFRVVPHVIYLLKNKPILS